MEKRNELHGGHRERLRQRLIAEGVDNFEPHELLEFLLYYAIPRQNVNLLAHELLNYFGNFRNVLSAEVQELIQVKGMGKHAATWLNLVGRCVDICGQIEPKGFLNMSTGMRVIESINHMDAPPAAPCLMQLCLNHQYGLLYRRILSSSRNWGEPELLREGIRDVFSTGARFVILILFSNDENLVPTEYDLQKVQDYAYALTTADCILLELLMIQGNRFYSLHQNQQIPDLKSDKRTQRIREEYLSDFPAETDRNTDLNYPQGGET